MRTKFLK